MGRRPSRVVAPAPMPEDPRVCRWCRLRRESADQPCVKGCRPNAAVVTLQRVCHDCNSLFPTGYQHALLCFRCDEADRRRHEAQARHDEPMGKFTRDQIAAGVARRAMQDE